MPSGYYGVNYDYGGEIGSNDDTGFATQLKALAPGVVRWPAGTGANYFVWDAANRRGNPTNDTAAPGCQAAADISGFSFTLSDLVAEYQATKAPPVFDLDVTGCASTPGQTAFDNQLTFLKQASAAGVPIDYLELGNEFYLCDSDYVTDFPSATAYADTAVQWIQSLHQTANFPSAQIAVVASNVSGPATGVPCHDRMFTWNKEMVQELVSKAVLPDAFTVHSHPKFGPVLTTSNLPQFFGVAYTSVANVSTAVAMSVTASLKQAPQEWLTEIGFSLNDNGAERTFADALANSAQALLLAGAMPGSTQTGFWSSFGSENPYAYVAKPTSPNQQTTVTLTPDGQVMAWVDQAAQGTTAMTPMTFAGGPVLTGTSDPALIGASFTKGTSATQILVNLSAQSQTLQVGGVIPAGRPYHQMSTADPTVQINAAAGTTRTGGTTSAAAGLSLAPYSITIVD